MNRVARRAFLLLALVLGGRALAGSGIQTDVERDGQVLQVRSTMAADAPADTCYAVLADFDRLAEFVPGLKSSRVVSRPGEPVRLHQVGTASAAFFHVTLDVTLAVTTDPPRSITFTRVSGNLLKMQGGWSVRGDATHCDIVYHADMQPDFWVPPLVGPRLMRHQVDEQMAGVLAEIARRASGRAPH